MLNRSKLSGLERVLVTKVYNVKDLDRLVTACTCEHRSVCADSYTSDGSQMSTVFLDKFNASRLFFPKLDKAVDGSCDDKVCEGSHGDKGESVAMHE